MKPVIIIALAFVLLVPTTVFAQTSSDISIVEIPQLDEIKEIIQESNESNFNLFWISIGIALFAVLEL